MASCSTPTRPRLVTVTLSPANPYHVSALRAHRVECGWGANSIDSWMQEIKAGTRRLYLYYEADRANARKDSPVASAGLTVDEYLATRKISALDVELRGNYTTAGATRTLTSLFVTKACRGKGYARVILDQLERRAFVEEEGGVIAGVTLNTHIPELAVLYGKRGYVETGRRVYEVSEDGEELADVFFRLTRLTWEVRGWKRRARSMSARAAEGFPGFAQLKA